MDMVYNERESKGLAHRDVDNSAHGGNERCRKHWGYSKSEK